MFIPWPPCGFARPWFMTHPPWRWATSRWGWPAPPAGNFLGEKLASRSMGICGDPWNLGLKNRPYMVGTSNLYRFLKFPLTKEANVGLWVSSVFSGVLFLCLRIFIHGIGIHGMGTTRITMGRFHIPLIKHGNEKITHLKNSRYYYDIMYIYIYICIHIYMYIYIYVYIYYNIHIS